MSKRKNNIEKIKNVVIILLIISAVFLGWQSRIFGNTSAKLSSFFNLIDDRSVSTGDDGTQEPEKQMTGEARPVSIAVTSSTGVRYGAKYDLDEISRMYNSAVLLFGEALGSAQAPVVETEQIWRTALLSPGVYFEYMSPIKLSILDGWFEPVITKNWGDFSVRRLCIATMKGENRLYFQDDNTGWFYAADTTIKTDRITKLTDTYTITNASFAFEIISAPLLKDPYALLMPDSEHPLINAKNPLNDKATLVEVLKNLGVSEHQKPITYADGTKEYIGDAFTIKLSPDGSVGYTWEGGQASAAADLNENKAIELARAAVADSIGNYCGAAKVYFDAVVPTSESKYQIFFKYVVAGGQIYIGQDGYAASVIIENGIISEMELHFRHYTVSVSDDNRKLLPEIQTAAAANGTFMLFYTDNGNDSLEPSWVVISPNS